MKNLYGAGYTLEVKLKHIDSTSATINQHQKVITTMNSTNGVGGGGGGCSTSETTTNIDQQQHFPLSFDALNEQEERSTILRLFVSQLFPDACLEESFADRLVYSVPQNAVSSLAQCFSQLERGIFVDFVIYF